MPLLSEHFQRDEFLCKCGRAECDALKLPDPKLVNNLEELRRRLGRPVVILSGLRCQFQNQRVGGEQQSAHLTGHAVDLLAGNSGDRDMILDTLYSVKPRLFRRIGIGKTFIHVDTSPSLPQDVAWVYYA